MNTKITMLLGVLIVAGCGQATPPADPTEIRSQSAAWESALNDGDIDALVAMYTPDARILPPNNRMSKGHDAIRATFSEMINAGISGDIATIETVVSGNIGYNVGTFSMIVDGTTVDTGKFIETWRRGDDGQWRISNDIFNSDGSANAAATAKTHVVFLHEVRDRDEWLAAWRGEDGRRKLFREHGADHVHTVTAAENPNLTGLIVSVSDMDALNAMLSSPEGQAAAAEDGVNMETLVVLTEAD